MTGRVDDVQADPVVVDRGLLGEDRDALLALEVAGVHDPFDHDLVGPERAGLAEHRVDERGLAVVDVGDDREVAEVRTNAFDGGRAWSDRGSLSWERGLSHSAFGTVAGDAGGRALRSTVVTVAAVILVARADAALADVDGQPAVRRIADSAWSGGALPIVVVSCRPGRRRGRSPARDRRRRSSSLPRLRVGPAGQICAGSTRRCAGR